MAATSAASQVLGVSARIAHFSGKVTTLLPQLCPDGRGGALVVWSDRRDSDLWQMYAQRVGSAATPLWQPLGVRLSLAAAGSQSNASIVTGSDATHYVVWQGSASLYLQRLDSTGTALWAQGGIRIPRSTPESDFEPVLHPHPDGGVVLAWRDNYSPVVQRVSADGRLLWGPKGIRLSPRRAFVETEEFDVVDDGFGGVFACWTEPSSRAEPSQSYVQHISRSGTLYWRGTGVQLSVRPTLRFLLRAVSDGNFGVFVSWMEENNGVILQHVDNAGRITCGSKGLRLAGHSFERNMCSDGNGGVLLFLRRSDTTGTLVVHKIGPDGTHRWNTEGEIVTPAGGLLTSHGICADGMGGALCLWTALDKRTIFAQWLDRRGEQRCGDSGLVVTASAGLTKWPRIILCRTGTAILAWTDHSDDPSYPTLHTASLFLPRVPTAAATAPSSKVDPTQVHLARQYGDTFPERTISAESMLEGNTVSSSTEISEQFQHETAVIPCGRVISDTAAPWGSVFTDSKTDGAGGVYLAWNDKRTAGTDNVYIQKLTPQGRPVWMSNGVRVSGPRTGDQFQPVLASGCGMEPIVCWAASRATLAQKFDENGSPLWSGSGVSVANLGIVAACAISDGAGGVIIACADTRAQRLDAQGERMWGDSGVSLSTVKGATGIGYAIVPDGSGGAMICWNETQGAAGVFAQRVSADGILQWNPRGVPCASPGLFVEVTAVSDAAGGVYVTFRDEEGKTTLQRLNAMGERLLGEQGQVLSDPGLIATSYSHTRTCIDGEGGCITVVDNPAVLHKITRTGDRPWGTTGTLVSVYNNSGKDHTVCPDGSGGAFITWSRGLTGGLYIQWIDKYGRRVFGDSARVICPGRNQPESANIIAHVPGQAIVSWVDYQDTKPRVCISLITDTGVTTLPHGSLATPPDDLELAVPYPNPSDGSVTLKCRMASPRHVRLSLVTLDGKELQLIFDGMATGADLQIHAVLTGLPSGLYFVRAQTSESSVERPLLLR
ncbi:MAG: T9SS type A sorting domain-containing protein [Ignavibacteriae bacterium]|nr:T9SS type A sorting domain-containing protein [Ignavibacteriota bacterium]